MMNPCAFLKLLCVAFLVLLPASCLAAALTGDYFTHDPSRITKCNGKYFLYCTGKDCPMRYSTDLVHWDVGPPVLTEIPAWAHQAVPGNHGDGIWAPDVIYLNKKYYLFYAFSTFGRKISVIGLVTSPTLDPTSPDYHWTDQGEVVASNDSTNFNAIDPCPILDKHGDLWLALGSWFGEGIVLVKLDKKTAKPISDFYPLAMKQKTGPEASYIYRHGDYYYLFENEGFCCRGVNSTYQIMMGRSKEITGPYLDKNGNDLAAGAGSVFLGTQGNIIGPGQVGIMSEKKDDNRFTFHYYDGANNGRPTLGFGTLTWTPDGWPVANVN